MAKYEKALFLYNGNSGNIKQKLAQTVPILSHSIKELLLVKTNTIEESKKTVKTFAEKIDLLIILGGDGTVHECVNNIAPLKNRPVIAILPGGTSNDFSRMLGIPQNLESAAEAIVNGEIVDIDLGKSNNRYFLNFWGIGLVSETSQNIDEGEKSRLGVLSYVMSTLRTVNQAESFSYKITTGKDRFEGEAVLIAVFNGKFIGTREIPIPTIRPNDGMLDVLIVKNSNLASFRELIAMNNPNRDMEEFTELTHFQADRLKVSTDLAKEIDMDGEIMYTTPSEIEVLRERIRMIREED